MSARRGRGPASTEALVRSMLLELALRFETRRPDALVTAVGRIAAIQATTMTPTLGRMLRDRAPEITGPVTRRAYAEQLRAAADPPDPSAARAARVAALHELCDQDYAKGQAHRAGADHRDDAHLVAGAGEPADTDR